MHRRGFTVPELLIVIATIAILVAIVVVAYKGVNDKANNSAVQSDLDNITGVLEGYKADPDNTSNRFPDTTTILSSLGIKATKKSYDTTLPKNLIYCISSDFQSFKLAAASKSGSVYLTTEKGFATHSLTKANLTSTFCTTQGMTLVSEGMSSSNSWQSWVGDS